jgi:hypothetical protein
MKPSDYWSIPLSELWHLITKRVLVRAQNLERGCITVHRPLEIKGQCCLSYRKKKPVWYPADNRLGRLEATRIW